MEYYTTQEVAELLRLKIGTVQKHIREGRLNAVKLGRHYRISKEELLKFIGTNKLEKYYTPTDVSRILKLNWYTVEIKLRKKEIKSVMAGGVYRIPKSEIDRLLEGEENEK